MTLLLRVPVGVVTVTNPVVAPAGTDVVMKVSDLIVKVAGVPLNETAVAPVKLCPRICTALPTGPPLFRKVTKGARPTSRLNTVPTLLIPPSSVIP
jgi:hypothetical protein